MRDLRLQCLYTRFVTSPPIDAQVSNAEAISFYQKFGFKITETIQGALLFRLRPPPQPPNGIQPRHPTGYYRRLTPSDCHKLVRDKK